MVVVRHNRNSNRINGMYLKILAVVPDAVMKRSFISAICRCESNLKNPNFAKIDWGIRPEGTSVFATSLHIGIYNTKATFICH